MQFRKISSALRRSNRMFNSSGNTNQKQRRFCVGLFFTLLVVVVFTVVVVVVVVVVYPSLISTITITKSPTKMEDQQQQQQRQQKNNKSATTIRYKPVHTKIDDDNNRNVLRFAAYYYMEEDDDDDAVVSVADWIRLMTGPYSSKLARNLADIMRNSKFQAYRFETPGPLSSETVSSTPFEFVLVEDTYLASFASRQDPTAFAEYLSPSSSCNSNINDNNDNTKQQQQHPPAGCVFKNLGGDAILVAPNNWSSSSQSSEPSSSTTSYCAHLANFIREASEEQIIQLWRLVAETLQGRLLLDETSSNTRPIWFSTAGTGVAWLHFRLDNRPKYYLYRPFNIFSPNKK